MRGRVAAAARTAGHTAGGHGLCPVLGFAPGPSVLTRKHLKFENTLNFPLPRYGMFWQGRSIKSHDERVLFLPFPPR